MFFQFSEYAAEGIFFEHPRAFFATASFKFLRNNAERTKGQGGRGKHIFLRHCMLSIRVPRGIEDVINGVIGEVKLRGCAFEGGRLGLAAGPFGVNPPDDFKIAPQFR